MFIIYFMNSLSFSLDHSKSLDIAFTMFPVLLKVRSDIRSVLRVEVDYQQVVGRMRTKRIDEFNPQGHRPAITSSFTNSSSSSFISILSSSSEGDSRPPSTLNKLSKILGFLTPDDPRLELLVQNIGPKTCLTKFSDPRTEIQLTHGVNRKTELGHTNNKTFSVNNLMPIVQKIFGFLKQSERRRIVCKNDVANANLIL